MANPTDQPITPVIAAATKPNAGRVKLKLFTATLTITPAQLQPVTILPFRVARMKSVALKESRRLMKKIATAA